VVSVLEGNHASHTEHQSMTRPGKLSGSHAEVNYEARLHRLTGESGDMIIKRMIN